MRSVLQEKLECVSRLNQLQVWCSYYSVCINCLEFLWWLYRHFLLLNVVTILRPPLQRDYDKAEQECQRYKTLYDAAKEEVHKNIVLHEHEQLHVCICILEFQYIIDWWSFLGGYCHCPISVYYTWLRLILKHSIHAYMYMYTFFLVGSYCPPLLPLQHSQEVSKLSGQLKTAERDKKIIEDKVCIQFQFSTSTCSW